MAKYFEKVVIEGGAAKTSANWITGDIAAYIKSNRLSFDQLSFKPNELAEMLKMIDMGEIHTLASAGNLKGIKKALNNIVHSVTPYSNVKTG